MIYTYEAGETVKIRLPEDKDNPTWFHVLPITGEEEAIQMALQQRTRSMLEREAALSTPEHAIAIGRRVEEEQRERLVSRIARVENAWYCGKACDLSFSDDIAEYIHRMPSNQYAHLKLVVRDANALQELSFRGESAAGAAGGAQEATED